MENPFKFGTIVEAFFVLLLWLSFVPMTAKNSVLIVDLLVGSHCFRQGLIHSYEAVHYLVVHMQAVRFVGNRIVCRYTVALLQQTYLAVGVAAGEHTHCCNQETEYICSSSHLTFLLI